MTDFVWPEDLVPYGSSFRLEPHTGGHESPFSRTTKSYGLSAPRWTCTLSFRALRGSRWGDRRVSASRLDAAISRFKGRQNRVAIYDFDYPEPRGGLAFATGNLAAVAGASAMTITGMPPGLPIYAGDYIGGDGRPHLIGNDSLDEKVAISDASGHATVSFEPPLASNVDLNGASFSKVTAMFKLTSDDDGDNYNEAGQQLTYTLRFSEDL